MRFVSCVHRWKVWEAHGGLRSVWCKALPACLMRGYVRTQSLETVPDLAACSSGLPPGYRRLLPVG